MGCWRNEPYTWRYLVWSVIYLFIFSACSTFSMIIFLLRLDNYRELTYGLYMMLTQFCGFIKIMFFHWHNSKMRQFVERIKAFMVNSDFEEKLVANRMRFFDKFAAFYYIMAISAIHATELMTIFSQKIQLPFSGWYPMFDWQNNVRHYWMAVGYQYLCILSVNLLLITVEIYFAFLIFIVSIQLEIIGHRLRAIGFTVKEMNSHEDIGHALQRKQKEMKRLIECINLHIETVEFKENIECYFNIPLFFFRL